MNTPTNQNPIPRANDASNGSNVNSNGKAAPMARPAFDPLDPQWQNGGKRSPKDNDGAGLGPMMSPAEVQKREQAGTQVMAARLAWTRGDKAAARTHLQQAFAIDASDCAGLELLGDIFLEEAEQEKAIAVFERGLKYHPRHHAFEEKIALALLDIEEMKLDKERASQLLSGDPDRWQDRKPGIALSLSLLIPGTGHFYNDENERGAWLLGGAAFTFGMAYWMFNTATRALAGKQLLTSAGNALSSMDGWQKGWFWLNLLAWGAIWIYAAYDAYSGAERANRARRRFYGV